MTIKARLFSELDDQPERDISGWQLYNLVPGHTYPSTLLQYAREYSELSGADFRCIDNQGSEYYYIPGVKLEGAILD